MNANIKTNESVVYSYRKGCVKVHVTDRQNKVLDLLWRFFSLISYVLVQLNSYNVFTFKI